MAPGCGTFAYVSALGGAYLEGDSGRLRVTRAGKCLQHAVLGTSC